MSKALNLRMVASRKRGKVLGRPRYKVKFFYAIPKAKYKKMEITESATPMLSFDVVGID